MAASLWCCAPPRKTCTLSQPYLATMCAELVLPIPGGPDSSTAFLVMSLGLAYASTNTGPLGYVRSCMHANHAPCLAT
jgi:hypothetical protein